MALVITLLIIVRSQIDVQDAVLEFKADARHDDPRGQRNTAFKMRIADFQCVTDKPVLDTEVAASAPYGKLTTLGQHLDFRRRHAREFHPDQPLVARIKNIGSWFPGCVIHKTPALLRPM